MNSMGLSERFSRRTRLVIFLLAPLLQQHPVIAQEGLNKQSHTQSEQRRTSEEREYEREVEEIDKEEAEEEAQNGGRKAKITAGGKSS